MSRAYYQAHGAAAAVPLVQAAASTLPQVGSPAAPPANDTLRPVGRVGIIGADATCLAIAMHLLDADIPVTLFNSRRESTVQTVGLARSAYGKLVAASQLATDKSNRRMALLAGATNFHHLKDCDLILAIHSSEIGAAEKLFRQLDELVERDTIFVTDHTAGIDRLARCTRRPGDVLGLGFPSATDPLGSFELARGKDTSEQAFATVEALLKNIRELQSTSGTMTVTSR